MSSLGAIVVNLHLNPDLDSGTAFYRNKEGHASTLGEGFASLDRSFGDHMRFIAENVGRLDTSRRCADASTSCGGWAEQGRCSQDPEHMYSKCTLSCGVCQGFWPGPHVPLGGDFAGIHEMYHTVAYKQNRLTVYAGSLAHGAWFSTDSIAQIMTTDPMSGRLMLMTSFPPQDLGGIKTVPLLTPVSLAPTHDSVATYVVTKEQAVSEKSGGQSIAVLRNAHPRAPFYVFRAEQGDRPDELLAAVDAHSEIHLRAFPDDIYHLRAEPLVTSMLLDRIALTAEDDQTYTLGGPSRDEL